MVVQRGGPFVEPSRMPGIRKLKMLKVEMVAVFVAKRAEKGSERRDLLLDRGTHPYPDRHGGRIVIAEKFTGPVFPDVQGPGCQNANGAIRYLIELRKGLQEVAAGNAYLRRPIIFHSVCNRLRERQQGRLRRQGKRAGAVAFLEPWELSFPWCSIGEHV